MSFGAPQIIYLMLITASLTITAIGHGKPKTEQNNNVWTSAAAAATGLALLWWGGFFSPNCN
jgi:hypothetical protein